MLASSAASSEFAPSRKSPMKCEGEWIVASASRPGIAYKTDGITCECEAAMLRGDPVCLHRAADWHAQGVLALCRRESESRCDLPAVPWRGRRSPKRPGGRA